MILQILVSLTIAQTSLATDMNFRFESGFCHKNRHPGFNPDHYGECGNLTGSKVILQTFNNQNFKGSTFNSTYIYLAKFLTTDLSHVSIRRSVVIQSLFENLTARVLDLRGSHIKGVEFSNSDLTNLMASGTRFVKTKFSNCNLSGANFWGSNLQESDFSNSDLRNANLENVFLLFTKFDGAKFNNTTKLPFSEEEALKKGMIKIDDDLHKKTN